MIKDQIFQWRNKVPKQRHIIPDVEDELYVYGFTALERAQYIEDMDEKNVAINEAKIVQMQLRDAEGKRVFEVGDLTKLVELPSAIVKPIVEKVWHLSGMGDDAEKALAKNSEPAPSDDS